MMMHSMKDLKRLVEVFTDPASCKLLLLQPACCSRQLLQTGAAGALTSVLLFAFLAFQQLLRHAGRPSSRSRTARRHGTVGYGTPNTHSCISHLQTLQQHHHHHYQQHQQHQHIGMMQQQ